MAGEHQFKELPYAYDALDGISEQQIRYHHDTHYKGYVDKRNAIEKKLETVDREAAHANYSEYRDLKREETFNASGMILHELYFDSMGGDGRMDESLAVVKRIKQDFGSVDAWKADVMACAKSSRGWALLCWDVLDQKLHNYLVDSHQDGAVWGAIVILPIDVWEHAYYHDQGPKRPAYLEAFLRNVDWSKVNARFTKYSQIK
jgi:Fe-Mn family superoxide dismutase